MMRIRLLGLMALLTLLHSGADAQGTLEVGYARLQPTGESVVPTGSLVYSFRNVDDVLVSEAGVGAVPVIQRGRIFVDQSGAETGVALVNPQTSSQVVNLTLRDAAGAVVSESSIVMEPGEHRARLISELLDVPAEFIGSMTFEGAAGLGATTLRLSLNGFGESLFTTLPVLDLDADTGTGDLVFPHLALGGGFTTQVVLINGSGSAAEGRIRFVGQSGSPLTVLLDGSAATEVPYALQPNGVFRANVTGGGTTEVGYAVLTAESGPVPAGSVVFQFSIGGSPVTETGVGSIASTTRAKISIDNTGRQTGFALANPDVAESADVQILLQDRFGEVQDQVSQTIPAGGHISKLAQELFPDLQSGFSGLLEIQSDVPIVPITLQITVNSRGHAILTTLPVLDLEAPAISGERVFPQIVIGDGFSARVVLIATADSEFEILFFNTDGSDWLLPPDDMSSVALDLGAGQGIRTFPGSTAEVASIEVRNPSTNLETSELIVSKDSTLRPRVIVVDTLGNARDDLALEYASLSPEIATVDDDGLITGVEAGFATLVIGRDDVLTTASISVIEVAQATGGFGTGVAQDSNGAVFVVATDHTILELENLETSLYAGTPDASGFINDVKLLAQFKSPSYIAADSEGRLYVADTDNHSIRVVPPGNENVTTLAGSGTTGTADGIGDQVRFNRPKGVAVDSAGFLWVVDQRNHSIRRINLVTGEVGTVAGSPGAAGNQDGAGSEARFNTPTGIAVEPEALAEQLLREAQGDPPPPVQVVVTDTGNGLIRRVTEDGVVTTVTSGAAAAISAEPGGRFAQGTPLEFQGPTGIAVDPLGTIYVVESGAGRLSAVRTSGEIITVLGDGTFENPNGILVGRDGQLVVASTGTPVTETRTAKPVITALSPDVSLPAGGTTIRVQGSNFEPEAILILAGRSIAFTYQNSGLITFVAPALEAQQTTLLIRTRGGEASLPFLIGEGLSLPIGVAVTGEISSAGEIDLFQFSGTAGDAVTLTLAEVLGGFPNFGEVRAPVAAIITPSGEELEDSLSGDINDGVPTRTYVLSETGTYLVRVRAKPQFATGGYELTFSTTAGQQ